MRPSFAPAIRRPLVSLVSLTVLPVVVLAPVPVWIDSPISSLPCLLMTSPTHKNLHNISSFLPQNRTTKTSQKKITTTYIQSRIPRHSPLNPNPHPFNHRQQNRTSNRAISRLLPPAPHR